MELHFPHTFLPLNTIKSIDDLLYYLKKRDGGFNPSIVAEIEGFIHKRGFVIHCKNKLRELGSDYRKKTIIEQDNDDLTSNTGSLNNVNIDGKSIQEIMHEIYVSLPKCYLEGYGDGFVNLAGFAHQMNNEKKIAYKREGKLSKFLLDTGLFEIVNVRVPKQISYIREKTAATKETIKVEKKTFSSGKINNHTNSSSHQANSLPANLILNLTSVDSVQGVDMIFDYYQRKGEVINQDLYSAYIRLIKKEEVLLYFQDKYEKQFIIVKSETSIPKPTKKITKTDASTKTTRKQKAKKKKTKHKLLTEAGVTKKKKEKNKKRRDSSRKGIGVFMESKGKGTDAQNDAIYKRRNTTTPKTSGRSQSIFAISIPMGGKNRRY